MSKDDIGALILVTPLLVMVFNLTLGVIFMGSGMNLFWILPVELVLVILFELFLFWLVDKVK